MTAPAGPGDRGTTTVPGRSAGGSSAEGPGSLRPGAPGAPGSLIVRLSWAGTVSYVVVAAAATASPGTFQAALMAVCVLLFVAGFAAFAAAYVIALGRSRAEAIGMGGLYFLSGSAPRAVQRSLVGSFAVETVAAVVSASIGLAVIAADTDNLLAFGILTPLYGLGLAGLWGARHGTFPARPARRGQSRPAPPNARAAPSDGDHPDADRPDVAPGRDPMPGTDPRDDAGGPA